MSPADKKRGGSDQKDGRRRKVWDVQRRRRRRELGQNFLRNERTARRIVEESRVTNHDLVLELGAGSGMLTRSLCRRARKVIAVEYDPYWASRLEQRFSKNEKVEVVAADALSVGFPEEPFKVVANVPFHITTAILHRFLEDPDHSPELAYLLVQKELARKHARPSPTTLKTLNWSPWWRFEAGLELSAGAFDPRPEVDTCLLSAARRERPLVPCEHRELFRAFVKAVFDSRGNTVGRGLRTFFTGKQIHRLARDNEFSRDSYPSRLTVHQWSRVFEFMVQTVPQSRWPGTKDRRAVKRSGKK